MTRAQLGTRFPGSHEEACLEAVGLIDAIRDAIQERRRSREATPSPQTHEKTAPTVIHAEEAQLTTAAQSPDTPPVSIRATGQKPDGPYEDGGQFGIRWDGERFGCDSSERQHWAIIREMWPPIDQKAIEVNKIKAGIGSSAKVKKWGINQASNVRKVLNRIKLGFDFICDRSADGVEVFRWVRIC